SHPPPQSLSKPPQGGYDDGWDGPPGANGGGGSEGNREASNTGDCGGLPPFQQDQPQGDQSTGCGNYIQFYADHEPDIINTSQLDGLPFLIRRSSTGKGKDTQGKQELDILKLPWSRRIEAMALQVKATGEKRTGRGRCVKAHSGSGAASARPQRTPAQEAIAKAALDRALIPVRSTGHSPASTTRPATSRTPVAPRTGVAVRGFDSARSSRQLGSGAAPRGFDAGRVSRSAAAEAGARRDVATKGEQECKKRALEEEEARKAWEKKNKNLITKEKAEREKREKEREERQRLDRGREARERRARKQKDKAGFAREKAAEAARRRDEGPEGGMRGARTCNSGEVSSCGGRRRGRKGRKENVIGRGERRRFERERS
ncbi:hypothetical protein V491_01211, partial [Pseudogymnoascus sp. VKM F-3775]